MEDLKAAVSETPDGFTILDEAKQQVAAGKFGSATELPAGKYTLRTSYAGQTFEEFCWINAATTTAVTFEAKNATAATPPAAAPSMATKFCTNCGNGLGQGLKFCTACGQPVGK